MAIDRIRVTRRALLLSGAALPLAACTGGGGSLTGFGTQSSLEQTAAMNAPVKLGLVLPLSRGGEAATLATQLKQAAELALFELNRPNITIVTRDSQGTAEGARIAAEDAIRNGAELIVGPLFAAEVAAVAPVAQAANIAVIAFSTDRKVAGQGVYLMSLLAGTDIDRIIGYTAAAGHRRLAALIPKTPYGDVVELAFRSAAGRAGVRIVALERYPVDTTGMLEPIERIKNAGQQIDALMLAGGQDLLPTVVPMLSYYKLDRSRMQLIGTGGWDYPNVGQDGALEGAWYPAPDPTGWRDFAQRYTKAYGTQPARIASFAYDAVITANPGNPAIVGKRVPASPDSTASVQLLGNHGKWSGSLNGNYTGRVFSTDTNTDIVKGVPGAYSPFFRMDASLTYALSSRVQPYVSAENLLDRRYYVFYLSPGRSVFGGVRVRL